MVEGSGRDSEPRVVARLQDEETIQARLVFAQSRLPRCPELSWRWFFETGPSPLKNWLYSGFLGIEMCKRARRRRLSI